MNGFMLSVNMLQASAQVMHKSAEMAEKDPHGIIITAVSVAVVFSVLIILYFAYSLIGKSFSGQIQWKERKASGRKTSGKGTPGPEEAAAIAMALDSELNGEVYAAIGTALHHYLNDMVHDNESYIITIRRK